MRYLTFEEILVINQQLTDFTEQRFGLVSRSSLEEAIQRPKTKVDNYEPFGTLWAKAAAVLETLLRTRPFLQANGLTALLAADMMLRLNGYCLHSTSDDFQQLLSVALQQLTIPQVADWLKTRSTQLTHF